MYIQRMLRMSFSQSELKVRGEYDRCFLRVLSPNATLTWRSKGNRCFLRVVSPNASVQLHREGTPGVASSLPRKKSYKRRAIFTSILHFDKVSALVLVICGRDSAMIENEFVGEIYRVGCTMRVVTMTVEMLKWVCRGVHAVRHIVMLLISGGG